MKKLSRNDKKTNTGETMNFFENISSFIGDKSVERANKKIVKYLKEVVNANKKDSMGARRIGYDTKTGNFFINFTPKQRKELLRQFPELAGHFFIKESRDDVDEIKYL